MAAEDLLSDPAWFLASVNAHRLELVFIRSSERELRGAAFLDGRSPIGAGSAPRTIAIDEALDARAAAAPPPDRLLIHTSFCGSTLLSRLLDGTGEGFGYREPQPLVELATLQARRHTLAQSGDRWPALLRLVLGQYRKAFPGSAAFVKPSNWANTLLPELLAASPAFTWVTLEGALEDYLLAVLRGGRPRIRYCLNLLNHLAATGNADTDLLAQVERDALSPMQQVLRLLVVAFDGQKHALDATATDRATAASARFTATELRRDAAAVTARAAEALRMDLAPASVEAALARRTGRDAKNDAQPFSAEEESAANARLRVDFGSEIELALSWRESLPGAGAG